MITLRSIHSHEIEAVKALIDTVFQALWGISYADHQDRCNPLEDIEHIQSYYFENYGLFRVLAGGDQLIGMGGISCLDAEIAEMMRIFLLQEYSGRGFGCRLVETLLELARTKSYPQVRLMVATPKLQPEAVGLYTRLDFRLLPTNPKNPNELHMVLEFS